MTQTGPAPRCDDAPRLGRPRDPSRDTDILDAAIDVLADTGFEGMTIDMVAARAKAGKATLYRRWPSKTALVLDALACLKAVDLDDLPDTGTLRGDLLALSRPRSLHEGERKMRVLAGVVTMLSQEPGLADAAKAALIEPRAAAHRILLQRAVDRGEIAADADIELLSTLLPAMATFRALALREPVDRDYMTRIIDGVLLPAAHRGPVAVPVA